MFTLTMLDGVKYRLSRLTYGMATWRGDDARRLAAECSAAGRTVVVIGCRFPPGAQGPSATTEWKRVRVYVAGTEVTFESAGPKQPQAVEVEPGSCDVRIEHDGPPPSFETTITVDEGRAVLVEIFPAWVHLWRTAPPKVRIWSGDDRLEAEHEL